MGVFWEVVEGGRLTTHVFEQLLVEANMEEQVSVLLFLQAAQLPPGGAIVLLYTADQKNYRPTHSIFCIFPNYADNACFVSQGASLYDPFIKMENAQIVC